MKTHFNPNHRHGFQQSLMSRDLFRTSSLFQFQDLSWVLMRRLCLLLILLLPASRACAQAEVGLIINAVLQGLQTAEAIRRSVDQANQFPNPPNQPAGDPIWNYDEASLVPSQVLRSGPYRNVQGQLTLSARQSKPHEIELLFYRSDGSIYRRELCHSDRRDGRRIDLNEKGRKTAEGPIRSGLPEGDWDFYSADGKLKAETRMLAGQMTGPQVLFGEDGKTRASNTLLEGKREGPSTLFHPDGSVSDNLFYSSDKLNGSATGWWSDGLPRYTAFWKNGQLDGLSIENFPSGMKKSETFYHLGKKEGTARSWDEKGHLLTEENWKQDQLDGSVSEFYPEGAPRSITPYLSGKKNGRYQSYNPDGKLATSGEFQNGKLDGPITLHYPSGAPFAECHYQGDQLTGGRLLYPDGKVLGQFGPILGSEGKVSSLLLQYPDGKPLSTARFDHSTRKIEWQGWVRDGSRLGHYDSSDSVQQSSASRLNVSGGLGDSSNLEPRISTQPQADLNLWSSQQSELEQQIGLSFPAEFNLLPK
jgi:antitoxin component YwqK of YwqJK toxin-antitoxin module